MFINSLVHSGNLLSGSPSLDPFWSEKKAILFFISFLEITLISGNFLFSFINPPYLLLILSCSNIAAVSKVIGMLAFDSL